MIKLFVFYADGNLHSASEGEANAWKEFDYLCTRYSTVEAVIILAQSFDAAWKAACELPDYKEFGYHETKH